MGRCNDAGNSASGKPNGQRDRVGNAISAIYSLVGSKGPSLGKATSRHEKTQRDICIARSKPEVPRRESKLSNARIALVQKVQRVQLRLS